MQASESETKKYEEVQQSEQSAFQANVADLNQAVTFMQTYTDMSAAASVAEEVCHQLACHVVMSWVKTFGLQANCKLSKVCKALAVLQHVQATLQQTLGSASVSTSILAHQYTTYQSTNCNW